MKKSISIILAALASLTFASISFADEVKNVKVSQWQGGKRTDFTINGRGALVVEPQTPRADRAWVWRPAFFGAFPNIDIELLKRGFHLAYCDFTHDYANPKAVALGKKFHEYMVKTYKLNPKVTLEGVSRGGAYSVNFAKTFPELVGCLYLDAPVCNFGSWPSAKSKAWADVLKKWEVEKIDDPDNFFGNPCNAVEPIAKAQIPVLIVAGGSDGTVPHTKNCMRLIDNLNKAGAGEITLILKPKCGHHPHGLSNPKQSADFIEMVYNRMKK